MLADPFVYTLPPERIAQRPCYPPEAAKMLVYDRRDETIQHLQFCDLPKLLSPSDTLVFNDTKVIPARLYGTIDGVSEGTVEILLLEELERDTWRAIGYPMKKLRRAEHVSFSDELSAQIGIYQDASELLLKFHSSSEQLPRTLIDELGSMPITPYIRSGRSDNQDKSDYQSIFAQREGSVAAPTASLHFSGKLIEELQHNVRCTIEKVTLHVGSPSFLPVLVGDEVKAPGEEVAVVSSKTAQLLQDKKNSAGRIVAVGTTVVRALESIIDYGQGFCGKTSLFIQGAHDFKCVDCLITNFHQPGTTHLLLVQALVGRKALQRIYESALDNQYRFLSYGDGMLVL